MTEVYVPLLDATSIDFTNDTERAGVEKTITQAGITHIEDDRGDIRKIFGRLNKKTVPLNNGGDGPQRLAFDKVKTFGAMEEKKAEPAGEVKHTGRAHAILSASSSHRWLNCTPAPRLEAQYPDSESDAAAEGTAAHELAEHKLRLLNGDESTLVGDSDWINEEMDSYTDDYVDNVMAELARAQETSPAAFLAIEQRLDFSHIVPDGFGTGDALIVGDGTMTVIDLKYGKGVEVSAVGNPQMRLYALGALAQFGMIYNIDRVRMVIFQPRLNNVSVDEISVDELTTWAREVVTPRAQLAIQGEGELNAGEWCRFCRHAAQCPALAAQYLEPLPKESDEVTPAAPAPETLTDDQIANIVAWSGEIKKWLSKVEKFALDEANNGHSYPGLKLVEGRSVRRYTDEDAVAAAVEKTGHNPYEKKLLGITAMTKMLGKKQFQDVLGDLVHKPAGKPTLVPESDKRPALQAATPEIVFQPLGGKNQ